MINEVYVSEETVALAKRKACEMLGTDEENVDFEIIQQPSKRILGMFGGKMAQIKASLKMSTGMRAKECIKEILFYMGLDTLKVEITEDNEDSCTITIDGDDIKYIVGKHGKTLDALEYIVGFIANNKNKKFCKVKLEAGNYRSMRREALSELGVKVSYSVLASNKPIVLEPMRSFERKIIHLAVGKIEGVKSWSEGDGGIRHVVVAPEDENPPENEK